MQRTCSEPQEVFFYGCELKGDFGNERRETGQLVGVLCTPSLTGSLVGVVLVTFALPRGT